MPRALAALPAVVVLGFVAAGAAPLAQAADAGCPDAPAEFAVVSDVAGDLTLLLTDGRTIAPAGVETPRATAARPTHPQDLASLLRRDLATTTIGLAPLAGRDRWGAIPAIVFTDSGTLSETLLETGDVRMRPDRSVHPCRDALLAAEKKGRQAGAGVWGDPATRIVDAGTMNMNDEAMNGLVLVEGTVASVGETATRLYLNLEKPRGGFAISLPKRDIALMRNETVIGARVIGTRLRVRGLVDRTAGLRVDVSDADALEILPPADKTAGAR